MDGIFCLSIIMLTLIVFARSCAFPVLSSWDDNVFFVRTADRLQFSFSNILYFFTHPVYRNYVPLTMLSYMFDYNVLGQEGAGCHIQSLFWHLIAVFGVFACFRFLRVPVLTGFLLTLVYAIHPQRVESVVWIAERRDVMCGAFYFWSLYFYMRAARRGGFPFFSLALFACALLSKAMAVTLPVILILYEAHKAKSYWAFKKYWKTLPFFVFSVAVVAYTASFQKKTDVSYDLTTRVLIALFNYSWYFGKNIWPGHMSPIYPNLYVSSFIVFKVVAFYFFFLGGLILVFCLNRRFFAYRFLPIVCAYTVTFSPVIGFFRIGSAFFDYADRYSYLPSFFFLLGAVCLGGFIWKKLKAFSFFAAEGKRRFAALLSIALAICYVIFLGGRSYYYSGSWKDYISLMSSAAMYEPPNYKALAILGLIALNQRDCRSLEYCSDRILSLKEKLLSKRSESERFIWGHYLKGSALWHKKEKNRALEHFEMADHAILKMREQPQDEIFIRLNSMMANCYVIRGDKKNAMKAYDYILTQLKGKGLGDSGEYWFYVGNKFFTFGRFKEAAEAYRKAREKSPEMKMILVNLREAEKKAKTVK